ncbi:WYL domain-containing protein [Pseudonocardia eucalypti]|uniref:WYL domain-containing protein n=1 Tax=Pseudonocardia eucalypti TaxID=648755 RepID=A0ABP9QNA6_9PSEU|nr:putative DNA-binding transcriptional regulator YafY [Pseudonocardia eucalypti]
MADVTERMLNLLSNLQTGRAFAGEELAGRLGVSPRTLRRDVERLRGYGYPVNTQPGPGGYYRLAAGRTMPPLVLDDDEALAALLGLAALAASGGAGWGRAPSSAPDGGASPAAEGGLDEAATRAYGKLDLFLPVRLRPRATAIRAGLETGRQAAPRVATDHLATLADAIAARDVVTFDYADARGKSSRRRVEPYRQIHQMLRWYLLAWDTDRADWRVFRVDRLTGPRRTGRRFDPRPLPAGSAVEYLRRGMNLGKQRVELEIRAAVGPVVDALKHQEAEITAVDDRLTRVVLWLDSWEWLVLNLAFLDADFALVGPPEFIRSCRAFAERVLTATAEMPLS